MSIEHQPISAHSPLVLPTMPDEIGSFAAANGIDADLPVLLQTTHDVFGDYFRVVLEEDAEIEGDRHLVFQVKTTGDVDRVLALEDQWHDRCVELAAKTARHIRLIVDIE